MPIRKIRFAPAMARPYKRIDRAPQDLPTKSDLRQRRDNKFSEHERHAFQEIARSRHSDGSLPARDCTSPKSTIDRTNNERGKISGPNHLSRSAKSLLHR